VLERLIFADKEMGEVGTQLVRGVKVSNRTVESSVENRVMLVTEEGYHK